jgi:hypothetical protein
VTAAGHRYRGGEITLNDITTPVLTGDKATMSFGARQEAVQIVDGAGNVVDPGLELVPDLGSGVTLIWSTEEHCWLVEGLNIG